MKYSDFIKLIADRVNSDLYICHALRSVLGKHQEQEANAKKLADYIKKLLKEETKLRLEKDPNWENFHAGALHEVLLKRYGEDCNLTDARVQLLLEYAAYHEAKGN